MIIIGGTYDEYCFEPRWEQKFGSGLRACWVSSRLAPSQKITFYTFGDQHTKQYLDWISKEIDISPIIEEIPKSIQFQYDYPLATPSIFPRLDTLEIQNNKISVEGDNILFYGMLEGSATVKGKRVVYDPQSPANPIPFSQTGSLADELAVVVNLGEASKIANTNTDDLEGIKSFFFGKEKASILILKMGPNGAILVTNETSDKHIPVYETESVWPIGSGDVFAASFATHWFSGDSPLLAARKASWNTAEYCNSKSFSFTELESNEKIKPITVKSNDRGTVYLAGPFFSFGERWIIDQIYRLLSNMKFDVFSPWHHVGHGIASEVVPLDLNGLDKSNIVFAVIDGLDPGTLFEIGYAIAKGLPVICYVEKESDENLKMMEGSNCLLEGDLTTAIYKTIWEYTKHV